MDSRFVVLLVFGALLGVQSTSVEPSCTTTAGCGEDPNAVPGCGNHCGKSCSDYKNKNKVCNKLCKQGGCDCKEGYVFDDQISNLCVRPEYCPKTHQCPEGEIYQKCGTACPKTCANRGAVGNCNETCVKGCFCPDDYFRNDEGKCVKYEDCTCNGDKNTTPGCGTHCGNRCEDHGPNPNRKCPLGCSLYGCDCRPGYVYDRYKKLCVKPEDCTCAKNETHSFCFYDCPSNKCADIGKQFKCPAQTKDNCLQGCVCKDGYRRNADGNCIKESDCPPIKCFGENEEYRSCPGPCINQNCRARFLKLRCLIVGVCGKAGCYCKDGFYRNDEGLCVPPCQCPSDADETEPSTPNEEEEKEQ